MKVNERKWNEMWLTLNMEIHYTKDEILEGYLNTINYGHGMYGIEKAANYYFNKSLIEYKVIVHMEAELLDELVQLILVLNEKGLLKNVTENLEKMEV